MGKPQISRTASHFKVSPKGSEPAQEKIIAVKGERTLKIKRAERAKTSNSAFHLARLWPLNFQGIPYENLRLRFLFYFRLRAFAWPFCRPFPTLTGNGAEVKFEMPERSGGPVRTPTISRRSVGINLKAHRIRTYRPFITDTDRHENPTLSTMRKTVNRSVLIIIPRQPYYDWGGRVFNEPPLDPFEECWSYLLDDDWDFHRAERFLKANYDGFFQELLDGMCTDPETWPKKRTWKLFNEWFDWHYSSLVWDLLPGKGIRRDSF